MCSCVILCCPQWIIAWSYWLVHFIVRKWLMCRSAACDFPSARAILMLAAPNTSNWTQFILWVYPQTLGAVLMFTKAPFLAQPKPYLDGPLHSRRPWDTGAVCSPCALCQSPHGFPLRNLCQGSGAAVTGFTAVCVSPANLHGKAKGSPARSSHCAAGRSPKKSRRYLGWIWCGNKQQLCLQQPLLAPHCLPASPRPQHAPRHSTALILPRSRQQSPSPPPYSDPSAPPWAPAHRVSEGGPPEWAGTSEKRQAKPPIERRIRPAVICRPNERRGGRGRERKCGATGAARGRPPWLTRSARRRPPAPAATPSLGRSSARRSPPISSMRTSRCGRCAAAPRSQPPGSGGAVEALRSAAGRAGRTAPLRILLQRP